MDKNISVAGCDKKCKKSKSKKERVATVASVVSEGLEAVEEKKELEDAEEQPESGNRHRGSDRLTGVTGSTSPAVTQNYFNIVGISGNAVPDKAPIPFNTNTAINGTAITHVEGEAGIRLAPNQTYQVDYSLSLINQSGSVRTIVTTLSLVEDLSPPVFKTLCENESLLSQNGDTSLISRTYILTTSTLSTLNLSLVSNGPYTINTPSDVTFNVVKLQ